MVADAAETPALPPPASQQVDAASAAASTDGFVRRSTRERKPAMMPTVQFLRRGAPDVSRTKSLARKTAAKKLPPPSKKKKKKKKKQLTTRRGRDKRAVTPKFLVDPLTGQQVWITAASSQDISAALKRQCSPYRNGVQKLLTVESPAQRTIAYERHAAALEKLERTALPRYGGRPWLCQVTIADKTGGGTPYFCFGPKGRLEVAAWPTILARRPAAPTTFPAWHYSENQADTTDATEKSSRDTAEDGGGGDDDVDDDLTERSASALSRLATSEAWRVPLPTVHYRWISPLKESFHSRSAVYKHAEELCKREATIERVLRGISIKTGRLTTKPQPCGPKTALTTGKIRFERDGLWVVGQEEVWAREQLFGSSTVLTIVDEDPQPQHHHNSATGKRRASALSCYIESNKKDHKEKRLRELKAMAKNGAAGMPTDGKGLEAAGAVPCPRSGSRVFGLTYCEKEAANFAATPLPVTEHHVEAPICHDGSRVFGVTTIVVGTGVDSTTTSRNTTPGLNQGPNGPLAQSSETACRSSSGFCPPSAIADLSGSSTQQMQQQSVDESQIQLAAHSLLSSFGGPASETNSAQSMTVATTPSIPTVSPTATTGGESAVVSSSRQKLNFSSVPVTTPLNLPRLTVSFTLREAENELRSIWKQLSKEEQQKWQQMADRKNQLADETKESSINIVSDESADDEGSRDNSDSAQMSDSPSSGDEPLTGPSRVGHHGPNNSLAAGYGNKQEEFYRSRRWCLTADQVQQCYRASMDHYEQVMHTVKARDLIRELQDGFDVFRERGRGRYDMELPVFEEAQYSFFNNVKKAPWMPIVRQILGKEVVLIHKGIFLSMPGAERQPYHQDGPHLNDQVQKPCHAINVFIPLVDLTLDNGPTEFCLGSHILGYDMFKEELSCIPTVPAGTPVIFDYRLGHRGLHNDSDDCRPILYCTYAASAGGKEFRDSVNFSRKRYHRIGDLIEKGLSREERAQKRMKVMEESVLEKAIAQSLATT